MLTPLSRIELLILLSVSEEPHHGYDIMRRVEEISEGRQKLGAGTLYVGIKRLVESGLIFEDEHLRTNRRRYYMLSPNGRQAIADKLASYDSLVKWGHEHGLGNAI
jgi:DNA-binding PadR family transcriptional regulator